MEDHQDVFWFAENRDELELAHYGVKGMRWGVRNDKETSQKRLAYNRDGGKLARYGNQRAAVNKRRNALTDRTHEAVKRANTKLYGKSKVGRKISGGMNKVVDTYKKNTLTYRRNNRRLQANRRYRDLHLNRLKESAELGKTLTKLLREDPKMNKKRKAEYIKKIQVQAKETKDLYEALVQDLNE